MQKIFLKMSIPMARWLNGYDFETKQESSHWRGHALSHPKKVSLACLQMEALVHVLFSHCGIVHTDSQDIRYYYHLPLPPAATTGNPSSRRYEYHLINYCCGSMYVLPPQVFISAHENN
jgi:hypothetical protein